MLAGDAGVDELILHSLTNASKPVDDHVFLEKQTDQNGRLTETSRRRVDAPKHSLSQTLLLGRVVEDDEPPGLLVFCGWRKTSSLQALLNLPSLNRKPVESAHGPSPATQLKESAIPAHWDAWVCNMV